MCSRKTRHISRVLYVEIVPPFQREGNAIRSNQEEYPRCIEDNVQPTGGGIDETLAAGDINAVPISKTGDKSWKSEKSILQNGF